MPRHRSREAHSLLVPLLLACMLCLGPLPARAAELHRLFEVVVNGRSTQMQVEFTQRDGRLYASGKDLHNAGLRTEGLRPGPFGLLALDAFPGLTWEVDDRKQELRLRTPDSALVPNEVAARPARAPGAATPAEFGAVLNYDVLGTQAGGRSAGSAVLDGRVSSPWGTAATGWLAQTGLPNRTVTRLDTSVTHVDPDSTRRWQGGDLITGGLGWTRPFRMGGVQFASDFTTRPDLVTYPVPLIGGRADVPSTVDLFVNSVRQLSQPVDQGPFQLRQAPLVTGAGDVAVVVRDVAGRETVQSLAFYVSPSLLAPGLASYSMEAGWIRKDYALATDRYTEAAASGSVRYGVKDWLTAEAHVEASGRVVLGGAGAVMNLRDLAVGTASVAFSNPARPLGGRGGGLGMLASVGIERTGRWLSVAASTTIATSSFQDVIASPANPVPTVVTRISLGASLGIWGSLRAAYAEIQGRPQALAASPDQLGQFYAQPVAGDARVLSVSYSRPLTQAVQFYANAYRNFAGGSGATGMTFGIVVPLGRRSALSASGGLSASRGAGSLEASQSAVDIGDIGWVARQARDPATRQTAQGTYVAPFATATAELDRVGTHAGLRAGASGALVATPLGVFASNRVADSYAVVDAGGIPDVEVLQENRPIGRTNSSGRLLVPNLSGWQANRLALNPMDLPADADAGSLQQEVRPPGRSGISVSFDVRRGGSALLRLATAPGVPVPAGSVVTTRTGKQAPVGYDGEVFLSDLSPHNRLQVEMTAGACVAEFDVPASTGTVPTIGPIPCTPWRAP